MYFICVSESLKCKRFVISSKLLTKSCRLICTGRIPDGAEKDLDVLHYKLEIRTLVDLRSPTELKHYLTLDCEEMHGEFTNLICDESLKGIVEELAEREPKMKGKGSSNPFKKFVGKQGENKPNLVQALI
uniref:Uncharacterized protein n=1 Tax=Eucampia antarctica TaxID=49252 RepID=A0A7S2WD99_9STRA|mmetsp:Transcript_26447/g.25291  ORF Transcript_26447/g.25291 Transcript_26447/m.25291 type:complete len:130 (+) Transcript_26447:983-1372(+)